MAKVPLRLYIREIENLIDRGQTEEALAHCKYILETYPKCIDVYRLLGKAYLETQRYGEAADILQRVLSSVPDDFVAHVGMSIIREDEGDLNAAVWHMERAYEAQPSNGAVQEELRRLYGRRDGAEPPKIRMTRGALVRMYARGHLFEQAIAEVRAALDEDPQRSDLQVLLAKLYAQTGAKVEATALCSELLSKFPYCFEANRILSEILPAATRAEDIATYKQRVIDLDPYMKFTTADVSAAEVPDQEVSIERMEWEPGHNEGGQPSWASSIGLNLEPEKPESHVLPDWLASLSSVTPPAAGNLSAPATPAFTIPPAASAFAPEPSKAQEPAGIPQVDPSSLLPANEPPTDAHLDLPDWMKEAGWSSSTGEAHEEPFVFDDSQDSGEAVMNTDLPEWLRTMAPAPENETNEGDEAEAAEQFAWLENLSQARTAKGELSIDDFAFGQFSATLQPEAANDEEAIRAAAPQPLAAAESEIPAWLNEISEKTKVEGTDKPAELPEIPEWLAAVEPEPVAQAAADALPQLAHNKEETMAWLEELAEQHNAEAPTMVIRPSDRVSQPPSWIDQFDDLPGERFTPAEPQTPAAPEPDLRPGNLSPEEKDHVESLLDSLGETVPVMKGERLPPQAQVEQPGPSLLPEKEPDEEFPDWLLELAQPGEPPQASLPATPSIPAKAEAAFAEDTSKDEEKAAMAWLDQLAATQARETKPEDQFSGLRSEVASAWMAEVPTPPEETPSPLVDLSFLDEAERSVTPTKSEPPSGAAPDLELPDWLKMIDQPIPEVEDTSAAPEPVNPAASETDLDKWLKENATRQQPLYTRPLNPEDLETLTPKSEEIPAVPAEAVQPPQPEIDMPAWLQDLDQTVQSQEQPVSEQPAAEPSTAPAAEEEEIPAWLKEFEPSVASTESGETPSAAIPQPEPETAAEIETAAPVEPALEETPLMPSMEEIPAAEQLAKQITRPEPIESLPSEPEVPLAAVGTEVSQPTELPAPEPVAELPEERPAVVLHVEEPPVQMGDTEPVQVPEAAPVQPEPTQQSLESSAVPPVGAEPAAPAQSAASLEEAQQALQNGQLESAVAGYEGVIRSGENLEVVIHNLREALYQYPVDISIWQLLGDAYLRSNSLQEAINAYTKAEELLR